MEHNTATKTKIQLIVQVWEEGNGTEFGLFLQARKKKTELLKNTYAETGDFIERLLYEIPESLDIALNVQLDESEKLWLKSKAGGQWFARKFRQYNVSQRT